MLAGSLGRVLPPLFLMGLIFWLGTDRASAAETGSRLALLLKTCFPALYARLSPGELDLVNAAGRKVGHLLGYALLGVLDTRAVAGARGTLLRRDLLSGWSAAVLWAAVDEVHQSFSPSRGASPWDVLLDGCGAAAGILVYSLWKRRKAPTTS